MFEGAALDHIPNQTDDLVLWLGTETCKDRVLIVALSCENARTTLVHYLGSKQSFNR